jgi:hypothetical protein
MPVPCKATDIKVTAKAVAGKTIFTKTLGHGRLDRCYEVRGTTLSPRYESCDEAGSCKRRIEVKNNGAYAAEFTVKYDFRRESATPSRAARSRSARPREIAVPCAATNLEVKAKAIAGKTIFTKSIYRAPRMLCFKVQRHHVVPQV